MKEQNGKIVTVFGGSGFIGRYIVAKLAESGYTVKIIARSAQEAKEVKTAGFVGQIVTIPTDITAKNTDFEELIKDSYGVVYCVGVLYETGKFQKFQLLHAQIPEKIATAAAKLKVEKLVHISAIVNENSKSNYARSKINGENAILNAYPKASILKPSVVFGAEDNFFNFFAKMAVFSPFLPLIGGGKTMFQPVYVGDVAEASVKAINENFSGKYELGGPQSLSFKSILKLILEYTNRKRLLVNQNYFLSNISAILTPSWVLTTDQVTLLKHDNVVNKESKGFKSLGIKPTAIADIVPKYLARYRKESLADVA